MSQQPGASRGVLPGVGFDIATKGNAMNQKIEEIHASFINGQRRQAVEQMREYGMHDFFDDYHDFLIGLCISDSARVEAMRDAATSFHRITGR